MAFPHEGAPCGMKSLRSDTLTMRVTSVRISVFSSAIVIDVIVHCHTEGALWVKRQKTIVPFIVWLGFDPFRPVQKSQNLLVRTVSENIHFYPVSSRTMREQQIQGKSDEVNYVVQTYFMKTQRGMMRNLNFSWIHLLCYRWTVYSWQRSTVTDGVCK